MCVALGLTVGAAHVSSEEAEVVQRKDLQEGGGYISITASAEIHFVLMHEHNKTKYCFLFCVCVCVLPPVGKAAALAR